jgi:Fe-S-cluster-containing dehydrogenase component
MVPVGDPASFLGIVSVIEKNCTGCRECEKACPYDAIFIYRKDTVPEWLKNSRVERAA